MDEAKVRLLVGYGQQAGDTLLNKFDMDEHRWRRFLVAMAALEENLEQLSKAYEGASGGEPFAAFLARYAENPKDYKQKNPALAAMLALGERLAGEGKTAQRKPNVRDGGIPRPAAKLRITPHP
jgi:hypothetical protein